MINVKYLNRRGKGAQLRLCENRDNREWMKKTWDLEFIKKKKKKLSLSFFTCTLLLVFHRVFQSNLKGPGHMLQDVPWEPPSTVNSMWRGSQGRVRGRKTKMKSHCWYLTEGKFIQTLTLWAYRAATKKPCKTWLILAQDESPAEIIGWILSNMIHTNCLTILIRKASQGLF